MAHKKYGLDIGTYNVKISSLDAQRFLSEKNTISIKDDKYIMGTGNEAYEMFEKAPESVQVYFPAEKGVISDINKEKLVLEYVYKKINDGKNERGATFLIAVPNDTTEVEKRAFYDIVEDSKIHPRHISMIDKSVADAVACHIDIDDKKASLVINSGCGTTDISVISEGGIVTSKKLTIAGREISEAIINAIKSSQGKLIGMKSADQLKCELADLDPYASERSMLIFGREIATGLPVKTTISSALINKTIVTTLQPVADTIKILLDQIPPEMAKDIREKGIYLTGGTAAMKNIEIFFRKDIGLPMNILKDPASSTIRGITRVLANPMYDRLRYYPGDKGYY